MTKAYEYDKLTHAGSSALLTCILTVMFEPFFGWLALMAASWCAFAIGIVKEIHDGINGEDGFSIIDVLANVIGILLVWGTI